MVLADIYNFVKAEGRVQENKYLLKNPQIGVYIIIIYVLLVKWMIPKIMEDRKPYKLKWILITYNLFLSLSNGIIGFYVIKYIVLVWKIRCDMRVSRELYEFYAPIGLRYSWYAWLLKYLELLDTIFFALRKKDNQITFLHLFHHSFIVLVWLYIYQQPYVAFYLFIALVINLFIHVIMYLYYGLAAFGPHMQKYLWWKKYLTLMQIIQFIVILGFALVGFFTGCEHADNAEIMLFAFVTVVLVLFVNFYLKSYRKKTCCEKTNVS